MIKEHIFNIKKIISMAIIDLKKIYKGAALGWFWIIAKPMVNILIYWFLFDIGLRVGKSINGIPYFMWLIVGLLPWFFISDMIITAPTAYKKYNYLVNKMKFPISTIPTFTCLSRFIVHIFLTIIVIIVYIIVTKSIDIYFISLPFYMIFMFLIINTFSNIFALISSLSKDVGNLIKTLQTPILVLSPIFWNIDYINISWIKTLQFFNPVSYFVTGYRNVFINKIWFFENPTELIIMITILIILVLINIFLHKKIASSIPDYL